MISAPTLKMAKRHFENHLDKMSDLSLYAADRLAFQIAIDCIDSCIEQDIRQRALRQIDLEVDEAMTRLFEGSDRNAPIPIG